MILHHHQMVSSEKKMANAMGGKTARACDGCIIKRARWYCSADDVFLCQFCDASVHSANPLARGHERVCLKSASVKRSSLEGFTKKSRSPRVKSGSHGALNFRESRISFNPLHAVPEIGSDEVNAMNSDDQLAHQVPVFNPFPSDMELAEFSADVESLLGKSLDEESFDIDHALVKTEEKIQWEVAICDDKKHTKMLKLNYEGIIAGWDDHKSPWTTGHRPELDPTDFWPDCMGGGEDYLCVDSGMTTGAGNPSRLDGGREARVLRYKEKRRTRLFSKKIRYEVRKVNAEKRPRIKGRFVKRAIASGFPLRSK